MSKLFKRFIPIIMAMVFISSMSITAFAGGGEENYYFDENGEIVYIEPYAEPQIIEDKIPTEQSEPNPFTPDGQATVVDEATDEDGKEFYTFVTPNENVFYLVIDKQRENENVYFLNAVTENDLLNLAEPSEETPSDALPPTCICDDKCEIGAVNVDCPVCINDLTACTGEEAPVAPEPEPTLEEQTGNTNIWFIITALLVVGGVGYYIKVVKPKKDLEDAEDLDDLIDEGEALEDGKTYNEDDFIDEISETVTEVKSRKINVRKQQNTEQEKVSEEVTNVEQEPMRETNDDGTDNDDPNADYMNGEDIDDGNPDDNYPPDAFDVNNERKI